MDILRERHGTWHCMYPLGLASWRVGRDSDVFVTLLKSTHLGTMCVEGEGELGPSVICCPDLL